MPRSEQINIDDERFCSMCGRKATQVRQLKTLAKGYVCDECDAIRASIFDDAEAWARKRGRDAAIKDQFMRFEVELENQSDLRSQFKTSVQDPKEPIEDHQRQNNVGDELANGFQDHPILKDKVQFNGVNENMKLPSMDPEQWENYLENQLQLQNQKRLQKQNEATMVPSGPS